LTIPVLSSRDEFARRRQSYGETNAPEDPMSSPTVTEIIRRPEAVAHDTFIDDLAVRTAASAPPADRGRER
jgi:hypothetical protein